jgi:ribosomal protein S18 acetylase RimI-like enzyme
MSRGMNRALPIDLVVRPYVESDEAGVISLWRAAFPDEPAANVPIDDIRRKLAVQRELFLVGTIGGRIVATVMAGFDGHRGWIYRVAVLPELRKRGYGQAMMAEAERLLAQAGCTKINLQVRSTNTEAVAFYRSLGFEVEERISMGKRIAPGK